MELTRRGLIGAGLTVAAASVIARPAIAASLADTSDSLVTYARAALDRHNKKIIRQDVVGIADFDAPSRLPRFHIIDMASGKTSTHLVAHGRGSDPTHSGWVKRFSNDFGSNASSSGSYLTGDYYTGQHGRSMRLAGLDPDNSNAEARAIVVHGAWYVSPDMVREHGKLGRSEGCFAFSEQSLTEVLTRLGPGRLLLAGKFA